MQIWGWNHWWKSKTTWEFNLHFSLCPRNTVQNKIIPSSVRIFPNNLGTQKKIINDSYGFEQSVWKCGTTTHWLLPGIRPILIESWATPSVCFFSAKNFNLTSVNKQIFVSPMGHDTKWIFNSELAYCD